MVVVTARAADRRLCTLLRQSCGEQLSMLMLETDNVRLSGQGADLIYIASQKLVRIGCDHAVFVVRDKSCLPETADCVNAVAVVDSSNRAVMELVAARRMKALTCGLSSSDTFTLSSRTEDGVVISLQRQLIAFDGTTIEPFELPVRFSTAIEPFNLLACTAVLCLLGEQNPLLHADSPSQSATDTFAFPHRIWQL